MLTVRNLSSAITDSLFVCPSSSSHPMLETGPLKFVSDLPLLCGMEPQHPRRSGSNMLAISHNRYLFRSSPANA
jgi:hypothetical protein